MTPHTDEQELRDKCASIQLQLGLDDVAWEDRFGNKHGLYGLFEAQKQRWQIEAGVAVTELILRTCKYGDREFYLSSLAVEQLHDDLKSGSDDRKALTALKKLLPSSDNQERVK